MPPTSRNAYFFELARKLRLGWRRRPGFRRLLALFLRRPDIQHLRRYQPSVIAFRPPVLMGDVVLALHLGEAHQVQAPGGDEVINVRVDTAVIGAKMPRRRAGCPGARRRVRRSPRRAAKLGLVEVRYMRSLASISNSA
jgi:hypothetical protein